MLTVSVMSAQRSTLGPVGGGLHSLVSQHFLPSGSARRDRRPMTKEPKL
jgi:hypothetical protein